MPFTVTVRPPLTEPLITPVTSVPSSMALSRSFQAAMRLAFSRDSLVEP